jgi:two-component system sensor histidine kinase PilS (NtrC family)
MHRHGTPSKFRTLRLVPGQLDSHSPALQFLQDRRLLLRWVYAGRLSVASTVMLASLLVWKEEASRSQITMVTTVSFAVAAILTVASGFFSEKRRAPLPNWFLYSQVLVDLLLVTLIVDLTQAGESPLAALYVVVISVAFLLLPASGGVLVTALGAGMYLTDVYLRAESLSALVPASMVVIVLTVIALVSRNVSLGLKQAAGSAELAEQLQHVKLQAADILRNIRSGIITVDSTGRLLQANPAAAGILGIEFEGYLERPVLSRIHEVTPDLAEMLVRTLKRPTRINRGEASMPRNGRTVPLGVTTTYAEGKGGVPTTATAIFQDITESKRMEHLSLRAERLAAVAELSASLAHEIKNPLASIRSAVEQLARVQYASEDERTLAALVERESDRLSRLLTEFLDFARVQVSRFQRVDLVSVARGACALAGAYPDLNDDVKVDFSPEESEIPVDGDEDLLHRAIFNLVLNAAQESPPGRKVTVGVRKLLHAPLQTLHEFQGEVVEITVSDQGAGINAEARARMFDPFFTTKSGGSGLGLSVVHRAITSHRGVVLVDTGDDGTKFTVLLPVEQMTGGEPA